MLLKFHVGNVATFLKLGYSDGWGYGNAYGHSNALGFSWGNVSGNGYGYGDGYYRYKDRQLVGDGE